MTGDASMPADDSMTGDAAVDRFWTVARELMAADERLSEGRIMSSDCLRVASSKPASKGKAEFVAMPYTGTPKRATGSGRPGMVVKLPADRVAELVAAGDGEPFAPAGRVFSEWVAITDPEGWADLLREAIDFVA